MTQIQFSKNKIRKLGDRIRRQNGSLDAETLSDLQAYRTSYKTSLAKVFNIICSYSRQIRKDSIVTYRIKRFESIIRKLNRYPTMEFDRMGDIAGCRCILKYDKDVYRLKELLSLSKDILITDVKDYILEPQDEGYKSLHLFVCLPGDKFTIEVQLRNQVDHNWATLVEITDLLYNEKIKEGNSNPELIRFHYLLSLRDNITLNEMKELFTIETKYKYLDRLSNVFSRNYLAVRKQWLTIEKLANHSYFIIEVQKNDMPKINSYVTYQLAEDEYYERFKTNSNTNMVLTHIPKATYEQISVAYSNYILTVHQFLDDCYKILERLLIEALKQKQLFTFVAFYDLYFSILTTNIINIKSEIYESKSCESNSKRNLKIREWILEINRQIAKRQEHAGSLSKSLRKHTPKSFLFVTVIKIVSKYLIWKYQRKLEKPVEVNS